MNVYAHQKRMLIERLMTLRAIDQNCVAISDRIRKFAGDYSDFETLANHCNITEIIGTELLTLHANIDAIDHLNSKLASNTILINTLAQKRAQLHRRVDERKMFNLLNAD